MGEQIGTTVPGRLYYVGKDELDRIRKLNAPMVDRIRLFADICRLNTLYMIAKAGSGHIGSSFSSLDIVSLLYLNRMAGEDVYFSSKGHDAPGLYALLIAIGKLPFEKIHALRRLGGLPGHPDVGVPGMAVNSGSLGMGISKAKGMVRADRLAGRTRTIYVLTGDGELQEGQIWESLVSAANDQLGEIVVFVDHNKLQSDHFVAKTSDLGNLEAKFAAFGWAVGRADGHDIAALGAELDRLASSPLPKILIADTVKGRGVSFMEHTAMESDAGLYHFHSGAPDVDAYSRAAQELVDGANARLDSLGAEAIAVEVVDQPAAAPAAANMQRLIPVYGEALVAAAEGNEKIVALDADLVLDTGLIPFRDRFPTRFVECGIAEMDMVSQAGGLALSGYLPVAHSFACFLTPRANEQIYNNATERTKVVYVGSLAGVVPGGPGHSHQAVRDIAALGAVPGLTMVEPSCGAAVAPLVRHCLSPKTGSAYIRLVSVPCSIPFYFSDDWAPRLGEGVLLRPGSDLVVVGYGPVLLSEAWHAAEKLAGDGLRVQLVDLPWLNQVNPNWLATVAAGRPVVTLDNHYSASGQGEMIAAALADAGHDAGVTRLGLDEIPVSGTNAEVLRHHRLDRDSLADRFRAVAT